MKEPNTYWAQLDYSTWMAIPWFVGWRVSQERSRIIGPRTVGLATIGVRLVGHKCSIDRRTWDAKLNLHGIHNYYLQLLIDLLMGGINLSVADSIKTGPTALFRINEMTVFINLSAKRWWVIYLNPFVLRKIPPRRSWQWVGGWHSPGWGDYLLANDTYDGTTASAGWLYCEWASIALP